MKLKEFATIMNNLSTAGFGEYAVFTMEEDGDSPLPGEIRLQTNFKNIWLCMDATDDNKGNGGDARV